VRKWAERKSKNAYDWLAALYAITCKGSKSTEYTVQIHRASIMRKIEADSFAVLVRLATKFTVEPPDSAGTIEMATPEETTRSKTKKVRAGATG
jgi:hypothetical protein